MEVDLAQPFTLNFERYDVPTIPVQNAPLIIFIINNQKSKKFK